MLSVFCFSTIKERLSFFVSSCLESNSLNYTNALCFHNTIIFSEVFPKRATSKHELSFHANRGRRCLWSRCVSYLTPCRRSGVSVAQSALDLSARCLLVTAVVRGKSAPKTPALPRLPWPKRLCRWYQPAVFGHGDERETKAGGDPSEDAPGND